LVNPGSRVAAGLSIGSQDEVLSVRLFSKVPIRQIKSLATDLSSMTSNALARIVLAERYGVHPVSAPQPPSLDAMLRDHDACLMIGDNGMAAEANGLTVLDLGHEWRTLTGLPFVWALWVGGDRLTSGLVSHLQDAMAQSRRNWDRVVVAAAEETGFSHERCRHYLTEIMDYRLTDGHLEGLGEFGRLAVSNGVIERFQMPEIVHPEPALVS
jgi:chorismate dehydratase